MEISGYEMGYSFLHWDQMPGKAVMFQPPRWMKKVMTETCNEPDSFLPQSFPDGPDTLLPVDIRAQMVPRREFLMFVKRVSPAPHLDEWIQIEFGEPNS